MADTDEERWREYEKRARANLRPHCVECGRFVPAATVSKSRSYWDVDDPMGTCGTHGRVYVTWERS